MPVGIGEIQNVTMQNITDVVNVSSLPEFYINVNHMIYGGWLFFILLATLWTIIVVVSEKIKPQILINLMYGSAAVSILSFLMRAVYVSELGVTQGLLTDPQMWLFPILTAIIGTILWITRPEEQT